jgi:hypothetical protein
MAKKPASKSKNERAERSDHKAEGKAIKMLVKDHAKEGKAIRKG